MDNVGVASHFGSFADFDRAKNLCTRSDQHVVMDNGAAIGREIHIQFTCANCNTLIYSAILADRARSKHRPLCVRQEQARSDRAMRRDFNTEKDISDEGEQARQRPQPPKRAAMRQPDKQIGAKAR